VSVDPRATFDRLFPALLAGDRATLSELLDEDVTWHIPPFAHMEPRRGRDAAIRFLCKAPANFYQPGSLSLVPEVQALEGDRALLLGWMTGTTKSGKPYRNRYAFAVRFREGRVIEAWELLDSKELFDQL